ncbi:MAG: undecaprenyl-diphosphatase UppP [Patescibacteria group bacterium]|nr:undecaprenyl-diphosphatase UppP [Patescibacteria group bacterium]
MDSIILGFIQGVTEFLPISSSGHLVVIEHFLGLDFEKHKAFDVAVHLGTLTSILIYFRKDIWNLIKAFFKLFIGKITEEYSKLILFIIIGTVPAVITAVYFEKQIDVVFRDPFMVAMAMLIVGIIFIIGEMIGFQTEKTGLKWWKAIIIGIAQAIALIPGVSRSGLTIVAGLFSGLEREKAARFSFLLGAPAMFGAGIWTYVNYNPGILTDAPFDLWIFIIGFAMSALTGLAAVSFLMYFLKKHTLLGFAFYLLLAAFLIIFLMSLPYIMWLFENPADLEKLNW